MQQKIRSPAAITFTIAPYFLPSSRTYQGMVFFLSEAQSLNRSPTEPHELLTPTISIVLFSHVVSKTYLSKHNQKKKFRCLDSNPRPSDPLDLSQDIKYLASMVHYLHLIMRKMIASILLGMR